MYLTVKTDYCLRVLIYLQSNEGRIKIQEIADALCVSKNHLSVAVNELSELGYVLTTAGPNGGVEFNRDSENRTVGELIQKLESFTLVECLDSKTNKCTLHPACKLKKMLYRATHSFLSALKEYKIRDLV